MANLQKIYADLDLTFNKLPGSKDVAMRYDDQSVISSVRNLLLTNFYERPFQPELGSNIRRLLFEPIDSIVASSLERQLQETIENFEPRVSIDSITAYAAPDENGYKVTLTFFILNSPNPVTINFFLERIR